MEFDLSESVTIESVREAAKRIQGVVSRTPVMTSQLLDKMTNGSRLYFKCEHLQKSGSFKIRGAASAITKLLETNVDPAEVRLVTRSSGNFGIGLAYAAQSLNIRHTTVLMRSTTPEIKKALVQSYGAAIIEHEPTDTARLASLTKFLVGENKDALFIPSGQSNDVISGQGTIGLELLEQVPDLDAIVVPVGGGGMIAGIATVAKNLNPNIKVIGAEPVVSNACEQSLRAQKHLPVTQTPELVASCIADGLIGSIGVKTWPIIKDLVDDVISVSEDEVKHGTRLIWNYLKQYVETCAGVAMAAVLSPKFSSFHGKKVGIIISGGNADFDFLKDRL